MEAIFSVVTIHKTGNCNQLKSNDFNEVMEFCKDFNEGYKLFTPAEKAALELQAVVVLNSGVMIHSTWF